MTSNLNPHPPPQAESKYLLSISTTKEAGNVLLLNRKCSTRFGLS
jgi:hypothetical protein